MSRVAQSLVCSPSVRCVAVRSLQNMRTLSASRVVGAIVVVTSCPE